MLRHTNIIIKFPESNVTKVTQLYHDEYHEQNINGRDILRCISSKIPGYYDNLNIRYLLNGNELTTDSVHSLNEICEGEFSVIEILGRLLGGKGGFGTLLRGKKGNKKKVTNYDACRDLSGRRIRHAKAVDRLKDWLDKKKKQDTIVEALGGEDVNYSHSSESYLKKNEAKNNCNKLDNDFVEKLKKHEEEMDSLVELGLKQAICREAELEQERRKETFNGLSRARKQALSCDLMGSLDD